MKNIKCKKTKIPGSSPCWSPIWFVGWKYYAVIMNYESFEFLKIYQIFSFIILDKIIYLSNSTNEKY